MSFGLSISLFFIIGVLYIVIIDFFTMLFRITGLTQEKARFQVISLLTNSGYSTTESELVVQVLPRRRLARTIMLFGYIFSITIVSVFVNAMLALPNSEKEEIWVPLLVVCTLFVVFMIVRRVPVVREAFNTLLEQAGRKWMHSDEGNPIMLQEEFPKGVIAAATLNHMPADLKGKTLSELNLPERFGLHVIYIRRGGNMEANLSKDTTFDLRDEVVVYGPLKNIREVFTYQASSENDLKEAAKPESAVEFIHQQDVENASRAAHAERAREAEQAKKQAEQKADGKGATGSAPMAADKGAADSGAKKTEAGAKAAPDRAPGPETGHVLSGPDPNSPQAESGAKTPPEGSASPSASAKGSAGQGVRTPSS